MDYRDITDEAPYVNDLVEVYYLLNSWDERGHAVKFKFNDKWLYSSETINEIYEKVTGMYYGEFHAYLAKIEEERAVRDKMHKESIPEQTAIWRKVGKKYINEDKWDLWDEVVPIRLTDIYQGMELEATISIISMLNDGCSLKEAELVFKGQGHSGASAFVTLSMIKEFGGQRAVDFYDFYELKGYR